tara:strand:- start:371 stop:571 length:201 start_codon:yes stop_codon:yes gene_type:complete
MARCITVGVTKMTEIINLELEGTWNVQVSLGNWRGAVEIPKALIPDAYDANQKVIDLVKNWVKENE